MKTLPPCDHDECPPTHCNGDSQKRMAMRACGTNTSEEKTRWVVEGWHKLGFWLSLGDPFNEEGNARRALARQQQAIPETAWRLVEVVERRTVIELRETSSHSAKLYDAGEGGK